MDNKSKKPRHNKEVVKAYQKSKPQKIAMTVGKGVGATVKGVARTIVSVILILIIICCIIGTAFTVFIMRYMETDAGIDLDNIELGYTTVVYALDEKGEYTEVQKIAANGKREWVDIENIPKHVQEAFVFAEDEDFYKHQGVDWFRTLGAFVQMVIDKGTGADGNSYGGSTITQQLIKNVNGDFENRTITTKVKEILSSLNVEKYNTKDKILECYLNYLNLGNGIYGVGAASEEYFGKSVQELSIVEAASLAVISKAPDNYNPLYNPENNAMRRSFPLSKMLEFGTITEAEYNEAMATELVVKDKLSENKTEVALNGVYSWYVDAALNDVAADLAEQKGIDKATALQEIRSGGYQIYTPMRIDLQHKLEASFLDDSIFWGSELNNTPQASMVIMDYTGNIVALVGGRGEKTQSLCFNRATQDYRSIGSCMKPITTYALALQTDLITYSSAFMDEPKRSKEGGKYAEPDWPKNWNSVWEKKLFPAVDALKLSKNTIPVELMQLLGIESCFNFVQDELGISTLDYDSIDRSENLTLGMTSRGVYLDEITSAYLMFGNGGKHYEEKTYTKVLDVKNKVVLEQVDTGNRVLEEDTAYIMNKMLKQVTVSGTGTTAAMKDFEVVGKTGTSDDNKEVSYVGLTPYYAAGIRIGYDQTEELAHLNVENACYKPQTIWKTIMDDILEGYEPANFNLNSDGVVTKKYCTQTGLLATSGCKSTAIGYYKEGIYPQTCAKNHTAVSKK